MTQVTLVDTVTYSLNFNVPYRDLPSVDSQALSYHYMFLSNGHVIGNKMYANNSDASKRGLDHYFSSYEDAFGHISKLTVGNRYAISSSVQCHHRRCYKRLRGNNTERIERKHPLALDALLEYCNEELPQPGFEFPGWFTHRKRQRPTNDNDFGEWASYLEHCDDPNWQDKYPPLLWDRKRKCRRYSPASAR